MEKLKTSLLILSLCLLGTEMSAQLVSVRVNLPSPPPPRVQVARPPCPSPDYIWHEGHWVWDNYVRDYVWSAGYWEYAEPRRCEAPQYYERRPRGRGHGHWKHRD
jgi:hypothetical protein